MTNFILNKKTVVRKQYIFSISAICSVSAVCFILSAYIGPEVVAFILLVTLSVIAMFFDIWPVLLSALLSALIWDYFFLLPRFNFRVGNTEDKIMLSMYFIVAIISAVLTFKIREMEKRAMQKEEKENALNLYNTLLDSLAHELKTPIATIVGSTDNLLSDNPNVNEADKKELLSEISKASLRLNQQVENLLNTSRIESGFIQAKKEWCDVNEIISSAILRLDEEAETHSIKVHSDKNIPYFKLDYVLLEQVFYNLIQNAIKYVPENSCIEIAAKDIAGGLELIVEDNGKGFPENETEKVFEKFYQLKDARNSGTGLGLSIVKGFVEAHQGKIYLQNKQPHGAKFTIIIPSDKYYNL